MFPVLLPNGMVQGFQVKEQLVAKLSVDTVINYSYLVLNKGLVM